MSSDKAGSSQLRLSGFSFHASIPSTTPPPARVPSLSLSICTGGAGREEQLVVGSEDGHRSARRARKNKQAALRSRARKEAYTQELEKEVQGILQDNLKLKRQLQSDIAALVGQQPSNKHSCPLSSCMGLSEFFARDDTCFEQGIGDGSMKPSERSIPVSQVVMPQGDQRAPLFQNPCGLAEAVDVGVPLLRV